MSNSQTRTARWSKQTPVNTTLPRVCILAALSWRSSAITVLHGDPNLPNNIMTAKTFLQLQCHCLWPGDTEQTHTGTAAAAATTTTTSDSAKTSDRRCFPKLWVSLECLSNKKKKKKKSLTSFELFVFLQCAQLMLVWVIHSDSEELVHSNLTNCFKVQCILWDMHTALRVLWWLLCSFNIKH